MNLLREHIFLVDGLGAVISTTATAFLLPAFQPWIGLPREVLLGLAAPAAFFAAYSLACWLTGASIARWLPAIVVANLSYCSLVVLVLAWFVDSLTALGAAYFVGEILVVACISSFEGRIVGISRALE